MLNTVIRLTTATSTGRIESSDWTVLNDCHFNACARSKMSSCEPICVEDFDDFDDHEGEVRSKIPTAFLIG